MYFLFILIKIILLVFFLFRILLNAKHFDVQALETGVRCTLWIYFQFSKEWKLLIFRKRNYMIWPDFYVNRHYIEGINHMEIPPGLTESYWPRYFTTICNTCLVRFNFITYDNVKDASSKAQIKNSYQKKFLHVLIFFFLGLKTRMLNT